MGEIQESLELRAGCLTSLNAMRFLERGSPSPCRIKYAQTGTPSGAQYPKLDHSIEHPSYCDFQCTLRLYEHINGPQHIDGLWSGEIVRLEWSRYNARGLYIGRERQSHDLCRSDFPK